MPSPDHRDHGFVGPYDQLQYLAAFAYSLFFLSFCVMHAPLLTSSLFQVIVVTGFVLGFCFSVSTYALAAMWPCHDIGLHGKAISDEDNWYAPEGFLGCSECKAIVIQGAKHCWKCHKCVQDFDHHCRWLNHCVGARNYVQFALFLSSTLMLLCLHGIWTLYYIVEFFADHTAFNGRCRIAYNTTTVHGPRAVLAFLIAIFFIQGATVAPLVHLFSLHVYLNVRGISTWQWIQENREEQRGRQNERIELGLPMETPRCEWWVLRQARAKQEEAKRRDEAKVAEMQREQAEWEREAQRRQEEAERNRAALDQQLGAQDDPSAVQEQMPMMPPPLLTSNAGDDGIGGGEERDANANSRRPAVPPLRRSGSLVVASNDGGSTPTRRSGTSSATNSARVVYHQHQQQQRKASGHVRQSSHSPREGDDVSASSSASSRRGELYQAGRDVGGASGGPPDGDRGGGSGDGGGGARFDALTPDPEEG